MTLKTRATVVEIEVQWAFALEVHSSLHGTRKAESRKRLSAEAEESKSEIRETRGAGK